MLRKINIGDGRELVIYIESRFEAKEQIENLSQSQGMNYILLQLDADNRIQYSSDDTFGSGEQFQMTDEETVGSGLFGKS
ncbi:hypothetical protein Q8G71_35510, partial [Klebsiella pneumoniae]